MSNEAFDIWLKENYLVDMSEFIVDEQERTYIKENNLLRKAWQAAKADSESILQEQQNTIAELEIDCNMLFSDFLELQAKNSELAMSINDLREALEVFNYFSGAREALLKTPKHSMTEHDNATIEKCAKVCESSDRHRGEYFAAKIRALKGK